VLGGGVAGLAAAFGLADRGYDVSLLESRKRCGGRAFSSPERDTGRSLDNGFHVLLGCYHGMRTLLRRLGTEQCFQQDRRLVMAYRFGPDRLASLKLSRLPVPLAMPWALLRLGIPFGARLRAFRGMASVMFGAPKHWTFADWLQKRGQHGEPDQVMWRPLCRAVMNVEPEEASASDFLGALREAFMGRASSAAFWLPKRPWSELLGEPAPRALANAGVTLRTGTRVTGLQVAEKRVTAIQLGDERIAIGAEDLVISAMPWFALRKLIEGKQSEFGDCAFASLDSAPIVTAYFTMPDASGSGEAPSDDGPVVALVGGQPFHFLLRTPGEPVGQFSLLSGGDRSFDGQTVAEIEAIAKQQLRKFYGDGAFAAALEQAHVRIRKEHHATFVAAPNSDALRPPPGRLRGGPDNLLVCGDWTATGLPATLEGGVRSAEKLLASLSS
jgi:squalene-associated FAD-dependent desaturase